jgi:hypothetical protein
MVKAEPAIRQLLKLDFEPKVSTTIRQNFRQTINQTLKTQLLPMSEKQADEILQQYDKARKYLEQTLEQEAQEKIDRNARLKSDIYQKIQQYNLAVSGINSCLQAMQVYEHQLPAIAIGEFISTDSHLNSENGTPTEVNLEMTNLI